MHLHRIVILLFVILALLPVNLNADSLEELDFAELSQEFEAAALIKDDDERIRRSERIVREILRRSFSQDEQYKLMAVLIEDSLDSLSENTNTLNTVGMGASTISVLTDMTVPDLMITKHLGTINNAITNLGGIVSTYQYYIMLKEKKVDVGLASWIYAKNMIIFAMNRFPWNHQMAFFAVGAVACDLAISNTVEVAWNNYEQAHYEVYKWFFSEGPGALSEEDWADMFAPPIDSMGSAHVSDISFGTYQEYLDAYWDNPERFSIPGVGNMTSTLEIYNYYFQNIAQRETRTITQDLTASGVLRDSFRSQFIREHLKGKLESILEHRRDIAMGAMYNQMEALKKEIIANAKRITNRKDYTLVAINSATGDTIPNLTGNYNTMTENGIFTTNAAGEAVINTPEMTPKITVTASSAGFEETVTEYYTKLDFGPKVMFHLNPTAPHGLTLRILDERTNRPIPNARIFYRFEGRTDRKTTEPDGYVWRDFLDGMFVEVTVGADGYYPLQNLPYQLGVQPIVDDIELQPVEGAAVSNLNVKVMTRYDDGPVPDATVKISSSGHSDSGTTNYQGLVSLKAAPDVLSTIEVSAQQYQSVSSQIKVDPLSPTTLVWLDRGSPSNIPTNLDITLSGSGNKIIINEPLDFEYSYNITSDKKHDIKVMVKAPDGSEHDFEYITDVIARNGSVSGTVRLDPPIGPGAHQARLMVRYGGKTEMSPIYRFNAEWPDTPGILIKGDSSEQNILRRFENGLASISPEPGDELEIQKVDWFLLPPGRGRIPSRENNTARTQGRAGLSNDLVMGPKAPLGKYGVEAEIITTVGKMVSSGSFELQAPADVPNDADFSNVRVRYGNDLLTGIGIPLTLDGLDFSVSELQEGDVVGLGQYRDQFYLDYNAIYFRPFLSGQQTAMFLIKAEPEDINVKFDCNVKMNTVQARPEDIRIDSDVEIMIRTSDDYVPPFRIRRQSPDGTFSVGQYGTSNNNLMSMFRIAYENIDEVPQLEVRDAEGAELLIKFDRVVNELRPVVNNIKLGQKGKIQLNGLNQIGAIDFDHLFHSSNLRIEGTRSRPEVMVLTTKDDSRRQMIRAIFTGNRGIAFVNEWITLEHYESDEVADADCEPPRNIQTLIDRMKQVSGRNNPMTAAMNQGDYASLQQMSNQYFTDTVRVFNWMSGLRNCDLLTNADRQYFSDSADVFLLMQNMNNPQNITEDDIQSLQQKIVRIQKQGPSVERRLRDSGFYELVFGDG